MTSPTQHSLKRLRKEGYTAAVVEHWNPHAKIRQDLFGIFDIVAVHPMYPGVLGVQTTTASNMSARRKKMADSEALGVWVEAGNDAEVHGWQKKGHRWECKIYSLSDILDSCHLQDSKTGTSALEHNEEEAAL
jgi:hypothetical protein